MIIRKLLSALTLRHYRSRYCSLKDLKIPLRPRKLLNGVTGSEEFHFSSSDEFLLALILTVTNLIPMHADVGYRTTTRKISVTCTMSDKILFIKSLQPVS